MGFDQWMERVEETFERLYGLDIHFLPDYDYWNAWNRGQKIGATCDAVLEWAGSF